MSRYYEMTVRIRGANPDRVAAVKEAAEFEWPFSEWYSLDDPDDPRNFTSDGQGNLCGGESEEEFAERLVKEIWEANGGYCEVEILATFLENLPYETYTFDEDRYEDLVGRPSGKPNSALTQPTKENQNG